MNLIQGKIISEDGTPVAGASVFISHSPVSVPDIAQLSNTEGEFLVSVPTHGEYKIQAVALGFETSEVTLQITKQKESVSITLKQQ